MRTILRMLRPLFCMPGCTAGAVFAAVLFLVFFATPDAKAFSDSFSDGNFSTPAWTGNISNWTVVANSTAGPGATGSQTLRLNATTATAGTQQLRTQIGDWGVNQQWSFWFGRRTQSATASNRVRIWLYANEAGLTSATVDGYVLTFGDDTGDDEIRIARVDNGVETVLATSGTAVPNNIEDYGVMVRVVRSASGQWQLYTSALNTLGSGGGVPADVSTPVFVLQATATDLVYTPQPGGYFGIVASHTSGANPRSGFEFDRFALTDSLSVHSVSPAANALHVAVDEDITIGLTSIPDASTITSASIRIFGSVSGALSAQGTFSVNGTVATWSHSPGAFEPGETITVVVTTGVRSAMGTTLEQAYTWQFSVATGTGSLRFGRVWLQSGTPTGTEQAFVGDLDNDGDPDVVTSNGYLRALLNDGTGVLETAWEEAGQSNSPGALADFNGDGIPDIFTAGYSGTSYLNEVLLGNGDGTFTSVWEESSTTAVTTTALAAGDFNSDGHTDVLEGTSFDAKRLWLGAGNGTFTIGWVEPVGDYRRPLDFATGDFDGDGALDFYEGNDGGNDGNRLWLNDGTGSFTMAWSEGTTGNSTVSVAAGDVDGDGDLDVVEGARQSTFTNNIRVWKNDGSGVLTAGWMQAPGLLTERIVLGDMDGDGDLDIVQTVDGDSTNILTNDGTGLYTQAASIYQQGNAPVRGPGVADFDGDNDLDIYLGARDNSMSSLWRNLSSPIRLNVDAPGTAQSGDDIPFIITAEDAGGPFQVGAETIIDLNYDTSVLTFIGATSQMTIPEGSTSASVVLSFRAHTAVTTTITLIASSGESLLSTTVTVSFSPLCHAVVTNANNDGRGSLRRSIAAVCTGGRVTFATAGTISLRGGEVAITRSVIIDGTGATVAVSGDNSNRVFSISGGAVVTMANLTLQNGRAMAGDGGNLLISGAGATLQNVVIEGGSANRGGGMYLAAGSTVSATDIILRNNQASNDGGGVYINSAVFSLNRAAVIDNTSSAEGGGVYILGSTFSPVNTTISGNTASKGGGVCNADTFAPIASTISGNTASEGGGVYTGNMVFNPQTTIVAGNTAPSGRDVYRGSGGVSSGGYNLIGVTANVPSVVWSPTDITGVANPQLGPLQYNGGSVPTIRPNPASPAIANGLTVFSTDARGYTRPLVQPDIGAVETNYAIAATGGTPQSALPGSQFAQPLTVLLTDFGVPATNATVVFAAPSAAIATVMFANGSTSQLFITDAAGATGAVVTAGITAGTVTVRTLGVTTAVFSLLINTPPTATSAVVVLEDDFNDNMPDSSKWWINIDAPGAATDETSGRIRFTNRGYLITRREFDPVQWGGITVRTTWTFGRPNEWMHAYTRADAIPSLTYKVANGVEYSAAAGGDSMNADRWENGVQFPTTITGDNTLVLDSGRCYRLTLSDDGTTVGMAMTDVADPAQTAHISTTVTKDYRSDYIVFCNSHPSENGTSPMISYMDDVRVEAGRVFTWENTSTSARLAAVDADGDALSFALVQTTTKGTLVFDVTTGSFTYTPAHSVSGRDSFTYSASDSKASTTGTVFIVVASVNDNPVITISTAIRTYTENDPAYSIDPALAVVDSDEVTTIATAVVQITDNFTASEDVLEYRTTNGIAGIYYSSTGTLILSGTGTAADYQSAFRSVRYNNTSNNPTTATRTILVQLGALLYSEHTGHYYESLPAQTPDVAAIAAASRQYFGARGYLATITSEDENDFLNDVNPTYSWIGGSDMLMEGVWRWVDGPEKGVQFWQGGPASGGGSAASGQYAHWTAVNPNNNSNEDYAAQYEDGGWDDGSVSGSFPFIAEYGGLPGEPSFEGLRRTIQIQVQPVNDAPVLSTTASVITISEEQSTTLSLLLADDDNSYGELNVSAGFGSAVILSVTQVGATGATTQWLLTPGVDMYGTTTVTMTAVDPGGALTSATFTVVITPVNDAPSFATSANVSVLDEDGAQMYTGFLTAVSTGPANEASQTVQFIVTSNNVSLFSVQPAISSSGTLTFTPAQGAQGTALVRVYAMDNGGTANGGINTSATQTFAITIGLSPATQLRIASVTPVPAQSGETVNVVVTLCTALGTLRATTTATTLALLYDDTYLSMQSGSTQATLSAGASTATIAVAFFSSSTANITTPITVADVGMRLTSTSSSIAINRAVPSIPAFAIDDQRVHLSWTAPAAQNITGYAVFRGTSATALAEIAATTSTVWTDTTAGNGAVYYALESLSGTLRSGRTMAVEFVVPAAVTNLTASALHDGVFVSWSSSTTAGVTGYEIYHGMTSGTWTLLDVVPATTTSYVHSGLDDGERHFYTLKTLLGPQQKSGYADEVSMIPNTLRVLFPNGGESFQPGTEETIIWGYSGDISAMTVEYSTDNGATWNALSQTVTFAGNKPLTTFYQEWTIPNVPTTTALVRVVSTYPMTFNDESDTAFTIRPLAPPTNLTATPGATSIDLDWTASTSGTVTGYRVLRGTTTSSMTTLADPGMATTYQDTGANACALYYYAVRTLAGNAISDNSNIASAQINMPEAIVVVSPNGGEIWQAGTTRLITWTSTSCAMPSHVTIELSTNNGVSWNTLATTANTGSYAWTIGDLTTTQARVRITGGSISDVSNAVFVITPVPAPVNLVAIAGPAGAALTWIASTAQNLSGYQLWRGTASGASSLLAVLSSSSTMHIDLTADACTPYYYAISAQAGVVNSVRSAETSATITLPQSITIVSPNGGEVWQVGTAHMITWTSTGCSMPAHVTIELSTNNGMNWSTLVTMANTGSYLWTIGNSPTSQALVRVSGDALTDISNSTFSTTPIPAPTNLVAVSGSSTAGLTWTVSTAQSLSGYEVWRGSTWGSLSLLATVSPATTSYTDNSATNCNDYVYAVRAMVGAFVSAFTNEAAATPQITPAITLVNPNGGELWHGGQMQMIAWTSTACSVPSAVVLEYSINDGSSWSTIATVANSGSYLWTIPNTPGVQAKVRVSSGAVNDMSDVAFAILATPVPVVTAVQSGVTSSSCIGTASNVMVSITLSDPIYPVGSLVLTATSSNQSVVSNGSIVHQGPTSATTTFLVTANATTSGVSVLTFTASNGFAVGSTTVTFTSTIHALPLVTMSGSTSACAGSTGLYSIPTTTGAGYRWTVTGGTITSGQNTREISVQWGTVGSGLVAVIAAGSNSCTAGSSRGVVIRANPVVTVAASGVTGFCPGGSVRLTASPSGQNYLWSNGATTRSITVAAGGLYSVVVTNQFGCSTVSTTTTVTVYPGVTVDAGTDVSMCQGDDIRLTAVANSPIGGISYRWSPSTDLNNAGIGSPIATPSTTTTYTVVVRDANGCEATDQITVTVVPAPATTISSNATICAGVSTQLYATGGTSYQWTPATGLNNAFIANPVASPSTTTTYTVVVRTAEGCESSDEVTVTVLPLVVNLHVQLEGAYTGTEMSTGLRSQGLVPTNQPYNVAPFNYAGTEMMTTTNTSVVDWVLVEVRTGIAANTMLTRKAALLLSDGSIVASDGSALSISGLTGGHSYYIVLHHRNHLGVMSATAVSASSTCEINYNFTGSTTAAYQMFMSPQKELSAGVWGMVAGDADASGIVNVSDRVFVRNDSGLLGYRITDLSLDGIVNAVDRVIARSSVFRTSQVPYR